MWLSPSQDVSRRRHDPKPSQDVQRDAGKRRGHYSNLLDQFTGRGDASKNHISRGPNSRSWWRTKRIICTKSPSVGWKGKINRRELQEAFPRSTGETVKSRHIEWRQPQRDCRANASDFARATQPSSRVAQAIRPQMARTGTLAVELPNLHRAHRGLTRRVFKRKPPSRSKSAEGSDPVQAKDGVFPPDQSGTKGVAPRAVKL